MIKLENLLGKYKRSSYQLVKGTIDLKMVEFKSKKITAPKYQLVISIDGKDQRLSGLFQDVRNSHLFRGDFKVCKTTGEVLTDKSKAPKGSYTRHYILAQLSSDNVTIYSKR